MGSWTMKTRAKQQLFSLCDWIHGPENGASSENFHCADALYLAALQRCRVRASRALGGVVCSGTNVPLQHTSAKVAIF